MVQKGCGTEENQGIAAKGIQSGKGSFGEQSCWAGWRLSLRTWVRMEGLGLSGDDPAGRGGCRREELREIAVFARGCPMLRAQGDPEMWSCHLP